MAKEQKPITRGASSSQVLPLDSSDDDFPDMDTVIQRIPASQSQSQASRKGDPPSGQARGSGPRSSFPPASQSSSASSSTKPRPSLPSFAKKTPLAESPEMTISSGAQNAVASGSGSSGSAGKKRARQSPGSSAPSDSYTSPKKGKTATTRATRSTDKAKAAAPETVTISDSDDESDEPAPLPKKKPAPRPALNTASQRRTSDSVPAPPPAARPREAPAPVQPLFRPSSAEPEDENRVAWPEDSDDDDLQNQMDFDIQNDLIEQQEDDSDEEFDERRSASPVITSAQVVREEAIVDEPELDLPAAELQSEAIEDDKRRSASPAPPLPNQHAAPSDNGAEDVDERRELDRLSMDPSLQALPDSPVADARSPSATPIAVRVTSATKDVSSRSPLARDSQGHILSSKARGKQRAAKSRSESDSPSAIASLLLGSPSRVSGLIEPIMAQDLDRSDAMSTSSSASETSFALDGDFSPGPPSAPLAPEQDEEEEEEKPVFPHLPTTAGLPTRLTYFPSTKYNHSQPNIIVRTSDQKEIGTRTELLFVVSEVFEAFFLREDWEETLDLGVDGLRQVYLGAEERVVGLLLAFASRGGNPCLNMHLPDDYSPLFQLAYQLGCPQISARLQETLRELLLHDDIDDVSPVAEFPLAAQGLQVFRILLNLLHPPSQAVSYTSPSLRICPALVAPLDPAALQTLARRAISLLPPTWFGLKELPEEVCEFLGWRVAYKLTVGRVGEQGWAGVGEKWVF